MHVVHVNASNRRGGAAQACTRLHVALGEIGVASTLLVPDPSPIGVGVEGIDSCPADNEFLFGTDLIQRRFVWANRTDISNTHFSVCIAGTDLSGHPAIQEADVIHLHWVASMQTPVSLRRLQGLGKPVVWTFHDQAPLTGGCHYSAGCTEFQRTCSPCPQLRHDPFGVPAAVLGDKRELLDVAGLTVIAPSAWMADQARQSTLFRSSPGIHVIPYGVDTEVFAPRVQSEARSALGLPKAGTYVLCGWDQSGERRKGMDSLTRVLAKAFSDHDLGSRACVLWVGGGPSGELPADISVIGLGHLVDDEQMALAYAAADLFVLPSLEDNLPNMLLEALSCATPVIAFAVGGIPEVLHDGVNGRLVPGGDEPAMAEAITALVAQPELRRALGRRARALVSETYSSSVQARRCHDLYGKLLDEAAGAGAPSRLPRDHPTPLPRAHLPPDPGPALGRLRDSLTIQCLTEELQELQQRIQAEDRERMLGAHATGPSRPPSPLSDAGSWEERVTELERRLRLAEAVGAARLKVIEELKDHWERAEAECAARLAVIESLQRARA